MSETNTVSQRGLFIIGVIAWCIVFGPILARLLSH